MAAPRIKFIWGASKVIQARWVLGLFGFYDRGGKRRRGLVVSLRGALAWGAALAVTGWFLAASVLFTWLERRPVNYVTWTDCVLLPLRWDEISRKRGQAYIAEGLDDFRAKRWTEGMMKVRSGLARHPRDWHARLELARFFLAAELRNQALTTLTDGLAHGYPGRTYLEALLTVAVQGEDYTQALDAVAVAQTMIRDGRGDPRDEPWLVQQRLQLLLGAGRAEEALQDPAARELGENSLNELLVIALLSAKRPTDAEAWLQRWRARDGATPQILRLQVRVARERGDQAAMERSLEELRERGPTDAASYIYRVVQRAMAGDAAGARAGLDEFMLRFSSRAENVLKLAEPLGEIGDVELLQQCASVAADHGYPARPYQMLLVQAHLARGEWLQAGTVLDTLLADRTAKLTAADEFWNELMKRLVPATTSGADGTQSSLIEFCRDRPLPLRLTKLLHTVLMRAGRYATARDIAGFALRLYPGSQSLAAAQAAAEEQARAVAAETATAREARLTETAVVSTGAAAPAVRVASAWSDDERGFFRMLEQGLADAHWSKMVDEIRSVRRAQPAWLAGRAADVARFEMKALAGQDSTLELIVALRLFLDGSNARNLEGMALVRQLDAAAHRETAQLVLAEILKKSPRFAPALRQQREWQPAAEGAEPAGGH